MTIKTEGLVTAIYVDTNPYVLFRLNAGPKPKGGYFKIEHSHRNFTNLYKLITLAVAHQLKLTVRTFQPISSTEFASVQWIGIYDVTESDDDMMDA